MALQTANQFQLTPDIGGAVSRGINTGLGIQQAQRQTQLSNQRTAEFEQGQQKLVLQGAANAAVKAQNLPTDEDRIAFFQKRIPELVANNRDPTDSQEVLDLLVSGQPERANALLDSFVKTSVQTGLIKPDPSTLTIGKQTSSQKDFKTFKQLNARAKKTGDPIDIQLAKQFGVQSGFDRLTPQQLADIDVKKTSEKALVTQAATASKEAFDSLKGVRKTIANMNDAIATLDKGAETGPIISKLPSFRQAAIELDNIKGRMGLDVVGATTFGALSESELKFALDVALPDSLEPAALKDWLTRKKEAQTKLSDELRKAASFLGTPGNTIADYIAQQEEKSAARGEGKIMIDDQGNRARVFDDGTFEEL